MKHVPVSEEAITQFVEQSDQIIKTSHADWHEFVNSHVFQYDPGITADPKSDEYLGYQSELWRIVSGRASYTPEDCEQNNYVPDAPNVRASYPFTSGNAAEVGNYFLAIANIFRHLDLPPGATVVEF